MKRAALLLIAALIYILWPLDLIPDIAPLIGWLDDLLVGLVAVYAAIRSLKNRLDEVPWKTPRSDRPIPKPTTPEAQDPYAVLGLKPGASPEEIHKAYREMIAQYHPDKVQHLGAEFRQLAEEKAKEIQRAYELLRT